MDQTSDAKTNLKPCSICGRTFRPEALERHENVCQKQAQKKRKVFDSKKQRAVEADNVDLPAPKPEVKASNAKKKTPNKKGNWREKHEDLIRTIRRSREGNKNQENESEPEKRIPSDYVQCPGCKRHFNERAADRHIPWCQKKQQQALKSQANDDAKEKLIARIKYKVPPPSRTKKVAAKPKTAGATLSRKTEEHQYADREKATYSSPPSFTDNRNTKMYRNQQETKKRDYRNESRGSADSKSSSSPDSSIHIIKFKERFPNHVNKRGIDFEESLSAEQLQELLRCSKLIDSKCPKTVPGVRLTGAKSNNWVSAWNNKESQDGSALPEVSSSEFSDTWMGKLGWSRDFDASASLSGSSSSSSTSSLPPTSRESTSEMQLLSYCHQCHHKFPLIGAKYCCECGARRRAMGSTGQSV